MRSHTVSRASEPEGRQMTNPYRAPEMITDDELRAAQEKARRAWSVQLLPLVPVVALFVGGLIYWIASIA